MDLKKEKTRNITDSLTNSTTFAVPFNRSRILLHLNNFQKHYVFLPMYFLY